jgi:small subunit ribosomal protein S16
MLRIRLSRTGAKKQPSYRIVVADSEMKRDGRYVERIGYYNPRTEPLEYTINEDRALYWLSVGAQPSDAVRRLLDKQGTIDRLSRLRQGASREVLVNEFMGLEAVDDSLGEKLEIKEEVYAEVEEFIASAEEEE